MSVTLTTWSTAASAAESRVLDMSAGVYGAPGRVGAAAKESTALGRIER